MNCDARERVLDGRAESFAVADDIARGRHRLRRDALYRVPQRGRADGRDDDHGRREIRQHYRSSFSLNCAAAASGRQRPRPRLRASTSILIGSYAPPRFQARILRQLDWTHLNCHDKALALATPTKGDIEANSAFQAYRFHPALSARSFGPPSGPGWLNEVKVDGYRVIARL